MAIAAVTAALHTPNGTVWVSEGSEVPEELVGQVREDLLRPSPREHRTSPQPKVGEPVVKETPPSDLPQDVEEDPAGDPADTHAVEGEDDEDEDEEDPDEEAVPYASYPGKAWATYANSLGIDVTGLTKAQIIKAAADHFGVNTDGLNPAQIVELIRAAA